MLRKADGIGVVGLLMLVCGGYLLFAGEQPLALWIAWLLGPLFWYAGFAVFTVWCFYRFFGEGVRQEKPAAAKEPEFVNAAASGRGHNPVLLREVPSMGGFIMVLLLCLALPAQGQPQPPAGDGASIFAAKCAMCHGPDGAGKTAMGAKLGIKDLRSSEVQKLADAELVKIVSNGKEKMPAYNAKLTAQQITDMVGYLRELAKQH